MTAQEVVRAANSSQPVIARDGCLLLIPSVALLDVKTQKVVHARMVDVNGKYPGHVHLEEKVYWWSLSNFQLA
jgi:hypothetical protein